MQREIAKAASGQDPMGIIRDPDHAVIDTHLAESLAEMQARAYEGLIELLPEAVLAR
jgi:hypothetical protein